MSTNQHKRDIRADILKEATHQFAMNGYSGTSIQAIAQSVGIKRPSLLYHFSSKEGLRLAVLESLLTHWQNDLPTVLSAATSGTNRLDTALSAVAGFFLADRSRARLIIREMLDNPDEMRNLFLQHLRPWTALITDYIRTGQNSGQIPQEAEPEAYIVQIILMVVGTVALGDTAGAVLSDIPSDTNRQIREVVRIAQRSLFNDI
jgi:TetR/AcrR family transcriptional regulator